MKLIAKKKGFTLIEIIVTMLILFIILAMISPLLNYNLKSLYTTENKNDLQREANYALHNFTEKAMEAKEIYMMKDIDDKFIVDKTVVDSSKKPPYKVYDIKESKNIRYINFLTGEGKNYIFQLDTNSKILTYKESDTSTPKPIAQNIEYFQIQPLPIDPNNKNISLENFDNCKGLRIEVKLSKSLVPCYTIVTEVKFRNWNQS